MSDDEKPSNGRSDVGYKSPPKEYQFKPNTSGNYNGRPPKKKNKLMTSSAGFDFLEEEAKRPCSVMENGRLIQISAGKALTRRMTIEGIQGSKSAANIMLKFYARKWELDEKEKRELLENAIFYKQHWGKLFEIAERRGLGRLRQLPHPDDVVIFASGEVVISGPGDELSKRLWDEKAKELTLLQHDLAKLLIKNDGYQGLLKTDEYIFLSKTIRQIITEFPPEDIRRKPEFLYNLSQMTI